MTTFEEGASGLEDRAQAAEAREQFFANQRIRFVQHRFGPVRSIDPRKAACRVRITGQSESRIAHGHHASAGQIDVASASSAEVRRDVAVPAAGWLMDDEATADQFGALVRDTGLQQLFSR